MLRAALLTAGQMASYDHSKYLLKKYGLLEEGVPLHIAYLPFAVISMCLSKPFLFSGSLVSGLSATTASIPADVIKTRVMNDRGKYKNSIDCLIQTLRSEGPRALFKGWLPAYFRLGPHFIIVSACPFEILNEVSDSFFPSVSPTLRADEKDLWAIHNIATYCTVTFVKRRGIERRRRREKKERFLFG